jgi:2-oxo-4-hydroxy-4-carboxy--5-ureidoimidazoline (OHCU) decarboxylase
MAVKGRTRDEVLAALQTRLKQDGDAEFDEALRQIEGIALLRLQQRLPRR